MTAAKKATSSKKGEEDQTPEFESSGLLVTAPLISVTVGSQVLQYRSGDVLPKGVDDETVKRLTDRGFIEKQ